MSIESLKQQARRHEQKEEWLKALDQYNRALNELAKDEQVDIGLHNRVGDLYVRVGKLDKAVEHYDKAVGLYREAYLPNNAIAVCKKIIRNVPGRHRAFLLIGQIRAEQGFIPDARTNFLTYAERMADSGDLDESFRALIEFCDVAPDDVGVRLSLADQMLANQRQEEAIEQLKIVRSHYQKLGNQVEVDDIESRILNLDPDADLSHVATVAGEDFGLESDLVEFADFALGEPDGSEEVHEAASPARSGDDEPRAGRDDVYEAGRGEGVPRVDAEPAAEEAEEEVTELPIMRLGDDDALVSADDGPLPTGDGPVATGDEPVAVGPEPSSEERAAAPPHLEAPVDDPDLLDHAASLDAAASLGEATELPMMDFEEDIGPAELPLIDMTESSVPDGPAADRAVSGLRETAEPVPEEAPPSGVEETPAATDEPDGGYVDFGAMILGTTSDAKSTRFTVAYEEPTGDEEADFARMLAQFKDKVSENVDSSDVRAHYDLGTAYKEMGLLDEAISSFQAALRASADHLPTYELMGQTFMQMGQPEAAVRSLERALERGNAVEDELVGIYYYLGRAYEELQNRDSAVEYYDRVFSLDINFADVTERLRALR